MLLRLDFTNVHSWKVAVVLVFLYELDPAVSSSLEQSLSFFLPYYCESTFLLEGGRALGLIHGGCANAVYQLSVSQELPLSLSGTSADGQGTAESEDCANGFGTQRATTSLQAC